VKLFRKRIAAVLAALACVAPTYAGAQGPDISASTKVVFLEATYMPGRIVLTVSAPMGACAAGTLLTYHGQGADAATKAQNVEAVFSMLLTAKTSNQNVILTGYSSDCAVVRFVSMN
jgi:hypothetical protein